MNGAWWARFRADRAEYGDVTSIINGVLISELTPVRAGLVPLVAGLAH